MEKTKIETPAGSNIDPEDDFFKAATGRESVLVAVSLLDKAIEDTEKRFTGSDGKEIVYEYPYRIRIEDQDGNVVSEESSSKARYAKDWSKKFYVREDDQGRQFLAYTRHAVLLALIKIAEAVKYEIPQDDRKWVGFSFKAILGGNDSLKFIDWVKTFEENGVEVPTYLLNGSKTTETPTPKTESGDKVIDPNSLPF